jgi:energy-coupling factor transporter ATP-binding protein EcfA2
VRLASITVENFRSITKAYKIGLGPRTVLVGPNNEGKSNILRALTAAMTLLTRERLYESQRQAGAAAAIFLARRFYEWGRDFPLHLQESNPKGESIITLEFSLTPEELRAYSLEIRSKLTGTLPLRVAFGNRDTAKVTLHKKGPGAKEQSKKAREIARFVAQRIWLEHVPAVRTAGSSVRLVEELVSRELSVVEEDPRYEEIVKRIDELQEPILEKLSANIKETLGTFLPDVKGVKLRIPRDDRAAGLRRGCKIIIDDGTPTDLIYKGDGVQSLAALGIMRHVTETSAQGRNLVLAIEEPESHLHPAAIHELRAVLNAMSERHQVVLTTHNPLFVDRGNVRSNIIVHESRARPATTIGQIREVLGVRAADNLHAADLVLVVEGQDDELALRALLREASPVLARALSEGSLVFDVLIGGSNLGYKLSLLRQQMCNYHVFLDDDAAGRRGFEQARDGGLIELADAHFATCLGKTEAELEDWYVPAIYEEVVRSRYGVSLQAPDFSSSRKWSVRMENTFKRQGKAWDDRVKMELKLAVAHAVAARPKEAVLSVVQLALDGLRDRLVERLAVLQQTKA